MVKKRGAWKRLVKNNVRQKAKNSLIEKAKSMKKTCSLEYTDGDFAIQQYLLSYPFEATIIFKLRGRSTNCLENRGRKESCRLCKGGTETQNHMINCPEIASGKYPVSVTELNGEIPSDDKRVLEIVDRVTRFENMVKVNQD